MAKLNLLAGADQSGIQGEKDTGYEDENGLGEFECANCFYFDAKDDSCGERHMIKLSKQPMLKNGRRKVDPEGCCEYVKRLGRED